MIMGSYPCCDAPFSCVVPDVTPAFFPEVCDSCGATVWHRISRADPMSWVEADFLQEYRVNDDYSVERIKPLDPVEAARLEETERLRGAIEAALLDRWFIGDYSVPPGDTWASRLINAIVDSIVARLFQSMPPLGIMGTAHAKVVDSTSAWGTSPTTVILDEIGPPREPVILGIDMGREPGFSIGRTRVYLGDELIGETDSLDEHPVDLGRSGFGGSMEIIAVRMDHSLSDLIRKIERSPPEPFHYSQLNPVNRNARRRALKRKR